MERGARIRKATESISKPLLIWCIKLLSTLKIFNTNCLCGEKPVLYGVDRICPS
jgi:hypothetical protein